MALDADVTSRSQALVDRYRRGEITRDDYLDRLRRYYHSIHANVRSEAIRLLNDFPEPERTRELIQLSVECQWRETQIAIIQALAHQPTQRGLEFLIHLAADDRDLGLCREAIAALGRSQAPLAARCLATRYRLGPAALKPYIAHALGSLLDRSLEAEFVTDLNTACHREQVLWAQSLVLALAELRVGSCVDTLIGLLRAQPRSIAISALLALGNLARDPSVLDDAVADFGRDFVDWQMLTNTQHQIDLRARWSIEDYLDKLFNLNDTFHPGLALELNNFLASDVREGLDFFQDDIYRNRLAHVVAHLYHPEAMTWGAELLKPEDGTDAELTAILIAFQARSDPGLAPLLLTWQERCLTSADDDLYNAWLGTCALSLPDGGRSLLTVMHSDTFVHCSERRQITAINHLVDHGLSTLGDSPRLKRVVAGLETLLTTATASPIQGRLLRALAQLHTTGPKAVGFAKAHLDDDALLPSIFQFFQSCPHKSALTWLSRMVSRMQSQPELVPMFIRAMAAQTETNPLKEAEFDPFLHTALEGHFGQDACLAALAFLHQHPRPALLDDVLNLASADERLRVAAVVTLKRFNQSPKATPILITCLRDTSESLAGRALDALTTQPDDAARWAIVEFLDDHMDDLDIVDKIIRCLTPPKYRPQHLLERLHKLVDAYPHHDLIDGLIQLRDRMIPSTRDAPGSRGLPRGHRAIPAGMAHELDRELTLRLQGFSRLDEPVKAALRSAELPYLYPSVFHGAVDKSTAIIEYCKAVDLVLERYLGGERLLPKLRDNLAAFQNTVYRAGLNEPYPNPAVVLQGLGLQGLISPEALPLAKMIRVSQSVLNGRIQRTQWRILDGLRAWGVVLLLFVRSADEAPLPPLPAPIQLPGTTNAMIIDLALRLNDLQELRNPVAHRRTLVAFADIEKIRSEIAELFAIIEHVFG